MQIAVNQARDEGADYVVVLSHLGELPTESNVNSVGLVESTNGIDVVLDGHSHSVIEALYVQNKDGKTIPVTQTGTKFANIGKLLIKDGHITTELIPLADCHYSSPTVSAVLDEVKKETGAILNQNIGTTDFDLTINDAQGQRLCRLDETNLGDLITDVMLDALPGHVSGMKYTIHTVSHTISDVQIYNRTTSAYEPLDQSKAYTVTTIDYYRGGGFYDTLLDCKLLNMTDMLLLDKLVEYIQKHQTIDEKYRNSQGRITKVEN